MKSKKKKGLSKFAIAMIIYATFLGVIIAAIDVYLYKTFASYQKSYEDALEKSNPDNFMKDFLDNLDEVAIGKYLDVDDTINCTTYEKKDEIKKLILNELKLSGKLSFARDEQWKANVPVYKILNGEKEVGIVSFKRIVNTVNNKPDEFILGNVYFGQYMTTIPGIKIKVRDGDTLEINEIMVSDEDMKEEHTILGDYPEDIKRNIKTYYITGLYSKPKINVYDKNGNEIIGEDNDYSLGIYEGFTDEVKDIVTPQVFEYLRYYNLNIKYEDYIKELPAEGNVKDIALSVKSGIKWREEAKQMSIKNVVISDVVRVNEDCFSLGITIDYYMKYEKYSANDTASYKCVFVKRNGKWIFYHMEIM